MIDLGKSLYEDRQHFFNRIDVCRIIVNPVIKGYPPIFLICKDKRGKETVEYVIGITFEQMNNLLMHIPNSDQRICIAEELAQSLIPKPGTYEFSMRKCFGKPLRITRLEMYTTLKRFVTEPKEEASTLYFFEWVEK